MKKTVLQLAVLAITAASASAALAGECDIRVHSAFDCSMAGTSMPGGGTMPCGLTLGAHEKFKGELTLDQCMSKAVEMRDTLDAADNDLGGVRSVVRYKGAEGRVKASIRAPKK